LAAIVGDPNGRSERLSVLNQEAGLRFPKVAQRLGREATELRASNDLNPPDDRFPDKPLGATSGVVRRRTTAYS
jgi:hypothetical protein